MHVCAVENGKVDDPVQKLNRIESDRRIHVCEPRTHVNAKLRVERLHDRLVDLVQEREQERRTLTSDNFVVVR